jgi:hypothetical protein
LQWLRSQIEQPTLIMEPTMMKRPLMVSALATALSLPTGFALAADPEPAPAKAQTPEPEPIYGSQLMTQQERTEYRAKMSAAETVGEQEQIRKEHHEQMKERAQARGVTLPDEPPARGGGMGPGGGGMGPGGGGMGMGQNQGMGKGMGRNRPAFSEYDLNGDGKITEKEFNEARSKRISERAQQGYQMRNLGSAPSFADIDANGDGEISVEEFAAHQSQRPQ